MTGNIVFRFLGKHGKITIPYAIRESLDLQRGDILSFEELDGDRILISRESLCVCNARTPIEEKKETLLAYEFYTYDIDTEKLDAAMEMTDVKSSKNINPDLHTVCKN